MPRGEFRAELLVFGMILECREALVVEQVFRWRPSGVNGKAQRIQGRARKLLAQLPCFRGLIKAIAAKAKKINQILLD